MTPKNVFLAFGIIIILQSIGIYMGAEQITKEAIRIPAGTDQIAKGLPRSHRRPPDAQLRLHASHRTTWTPPAAGPCPELFVFSA